MSKLKILVVDDCEHTQEMLTTFFATDFNVKTVADAEGALELLADCSFDLVLVDLGLPKMDGNKFCLNVRQKHRHLPIIIFSGRTDVDDRLLAFSVGANDFVPKPADLRELRARILAQTNKSSLSKNLETGPILVDTDRQAIFIRENSSQSEIPLSPLEYKICLFFLKHIDHVISREQLLQQVWGESRFVSDRCVDTVICKIRTKLGAHSSLLQSVRGVGYRFSAPESLKKSQSA